MSICHFNHSFYFSGETSSPKSFAHLAKFSADIYPLSSSSYILNTFFNSSSWFLISIYSAINAVNSSLSIAPEPSLSHYVIFYLTSSFFKKIPNAFIASLSSFTSIDPDLSLSNNKNALSISSFYSSVNSLAFFVTLFIIFFLFPGYEPSPGIVL
jgi:hypothetical protein